MTLFLFSCLVHVLMYVHVFIVSVCHTCRYILTMMSILGEKRFLAHYQHLYPFTIEEEILSQSSKYVVDDTRLQYIRDAVSEASRTYMSARRSKAPVAKTTSTALSTKVGYFTRRYKIVCLSYKAGTDKCSPSGFLVRCSAQTSHYS